VTVTPAMAASHDRAAGGINRAQRRKALWRRVVVDGLNCAQAGREWGISGARARDLVLKDAHLRGYHEPPYVWIRDEGGPRYCITLRREVLKAIRIQYRIRKGDFDPWWEDLTEAIDRYRAQGQALYRRWQEVKHHAPA
jgi:hypothetical protein